MKTNIFWLGNSYLDNTLHFNKMAGNHNSGRKGCYDEIVVRKIINAANSIILNTLEGTGKYANVSVETLVEVASKFSLRVIPQTIDADGIEGVAMIVFRNPRALAEDANRNSDPKATPLLTG